MSAVGRGMPAGLHVSLPAFQVPTSLGLAKITSAGDASAQRSTSSEWRGRCCGVRSATTGACGRCRRCVRCCSRPALTTCDSHALFTSPLSAHARRPGQRYTLSLTLVVIQPHRNAPHSLRRSSVVCCNSMPTPSNGPRLHSWQWRTRWTPTSRLVIRCLLTLPFPERPWCSKFC